MSHKYSFKEIKKHILSEPLLKVEGVTTVPETIKEFLDLFLNDWNRSSRTLYLNNIAQTQKGRRRTMSDIYRIVRHYYPDAKLSEVYRAIVELIEENRICSAFCEVVRGRVYRGTMASTYQKGEGFFNSTPTDEYGIDFSQYPQFDNLRKNEIGWGNTYYTSIIKSINL